MTSTSAVLPGRRYASDGLARFGWRHPEWAAALAVVAAWGLLVVHHAGGLGGHHAGSAEGGYSHAGWVLTIGAWLTMTVAMMVPTVVPSVRYVALNSLRQRRQRAVAVFLGGYLAVWAGFGAVAIPLVDAARGPVEARLGGEGLLVVTLVVAAAFELTAVKRRALRACHRTVPLPPLGRRADAACLRYGLRHGTACLTGCWALMVAMVAAGHSGLLLMVLVTAVVTAEKVAVAGTQLGPQAATALGAAAVMVAV